MDPHAAIAFLESWGYPALTVLLTATGFGIPIPEDLLLLTAGYLISADVFSWRAALPLAYCGVIASDCILYWLGTRMRTHSKGWLRPVVRPARLRMATRWLRRGAVVVFLARLVPGTRAVTFVSAGICRVPFHKFLLFDALGAIIWVPLVLFVGARVGHEIGGIDRLFQQIANVVWLLAFVVILLALAWRFFRTEEAKL